MLRALTELAGKLDLPPPMYQPTTVSWFIDLDPDGRLRGFVPLASSEKGKRGQRRLAPHVKRTSGIAPKLLADNGEYVLGMAGEDSKPGRVAAQRDAFTALARVCAEKTGHPKVWAAVRFLEGLHLPEVVLPKDLKADEVLTFRVGEDVLIDLPEVQAFWAAYSDSGGEGGEAPVMTCLICGEARPVLERLPIPLKGIPGGKTSGTELVSANLEAFTSHGLEASLNSPICRLCAENFGNALNHLIADGSSRLYVGPTVYTFWTREGSDFRPAVLLAQPDDDVLAQIARELEERLRQEVRPGEVKVALEAPLTGREPYVDADLFYAVGLSANSARAVVRDWIATTLPEAKAHLHRWFVAQRIVQADGGSPRPLPLLLLAESLYRDPAKEMSPRIVPSLLRSALKGDRIPADLLSLAVKRCRVAQNGQEGGKVPHPRAALIKLVLTHGGDEMEAQTLQSLDMERRDPGYQCGRLLAVLEEIQRAALPGIKATLTDRFYGSFSSAPASVFGVLLKDAQAHLGKLRKSKEGAYHRLDRAVQEVAGRIQEPPRTLTLKEQALFALGYYHQKAAFRAARAAQSGQREEK